MKCSKIFRTLTVAVILSLLIVLIPSTPALAAPEITLSPTFGSIGTKVTITGTNFESYRGDIISIFFDGVEIANSPLTIPETGSFTTYFNIPDDATPGRAWVRIKSDVGTQLASSSFITWETEIELYPPDGAVGTIVTIKGKGFYADETVTVCYYNRTKETLGTEVATPAGEFTCTFTIPDSTAGEHKIVVEDAEGNSAKANFEVIPSTTLNPTSGAMGDEITVSGAGFGDDADVTIYLNNIEMATTQTDKNGSFETTFYVPVIKPDTYNIEAKDDGGNRGKTGFTVTAGASLSQTTGNVGTPLIVSGTGFKVGGVVTITYDAVEVKTAIAGNNGAFSIAFNVPPSVGGNHTIIITDGTSIINRIFTMESEAPPIPALLLPEDATKAEAEAYFDWEDVDDPSGITYTLQVASDDSFTPTSILLEKADLIYSDYSITKEEELQTTIKEAPYYWRVKAIDGASNESQWSTPGSFYVGSSFSLPGWALYTLIGLGALLIGFLAFWLGRRTAYYRSFKG